MAISTYQTALMYKKSAAWEKLIDIKSFPDLGGTPELIETTTLSDAATTNIMGIQSMDALEFECNYTLADYTRLQAMAGQEQDFAVWLGNAGADGKFAFKGQLAVYVNGGGVNEVVNMTVSIAASTAITLGENA